MVRFPALLSSLHQCQDKNGHGGRCNMTAPNEKMMTKKTEPFLLACSASLFGAAQVTMWRVHHNHHSQIMSGIAFLWTMQKWMQQSHACGWEWLLSICHDNWRNTTHMFVSFLFHVMIDQPDSGLKEKSQWTIDHTTWHCLVFWRLCLLVVAWKSMKVVERWFSCNWCKKLCGKMQGEKQLNPTDTKFNS